MYSRSAMKKKAAQKPRKSPTQSRSAETVAVILEAAARVLEEKGLEGYNTNAVAERAGVSVGSLYQYFRNKDSLLASLLEREAEPFLAALERIPGEAPFQTALLLLIEASVQQQLRRPKLARLLDFIERQAAFEDLATSTVDRAQHVISNLLDREGAPKVEDRPTAAMEVLSVIRALTDAAGERGERDSSRLVHRIHGAVCGYFAVDFRETSKLAQASETGGTVSLTPKVRNKATTRSAASGA